MRRQHMPDMKEGGVNVTPLIDIVMVLIIFFMLVAKIGVSRGEDKSIQLPSTILGKKIESFSNTMTLNIHANVNADEPIITTMIDNQTRELHVAGQSRSGSADDVLKNVLETFHKHFADKAAVIIRADRDLPYRQLEVVLLACANAGISNVSYETKPGNDNNPNATASARARAPWLFRVESERLS